MLLMQDKLRTIENRKLRPLARRLGPSVVILSLLVPGAYAQSQLTKDYKKNLEQYFSINAANKNFSGNVIIAKDDKVLFSKSYGMAKYEWRIPQNPDTKIRTASITKTFTAAAVLILIHERKLALKQTIEESIPGFPLGSKITIEQLLRHESGIPNPDYSKLNFKHHLSREDILETIKSKPLLFEPGTNNSYSNGGYFLLAYIIERITGKEYGDFLREKIFSPLGLADTGVYEDGSIIPNLTFEANETGEVKSLIISFGNDPGTVAPKIE